jgi:hypothetical protein
MPVDRQAQVFDANEALQLPRLIGRMKQNWLYNGGLCIEKLVLCSRKSQTKGNCQDLPNKGIRHTRENLSEMLNGSMTTAVVEIVDMVNF